MGHPIHGLDGFCLRIRADWIARLFDESGITRRNYLQHCPTHKMPLICLNWALTKLMNLMKIPFSAALAIVFVFTFFFKTFLIEVCLYSAVRSDTVSRTREESRRGSVLEIFKRRQHLLPPSCSSWSAVNWSHYRWSQK
jgi:hypothetical protein